MAKTLLYVAGFFCLLIIVYDKATRFMVNKYTSECYFGKKGSGKTSRIAMLCNKYRKQGFKKFYCNVPVKGTILYDPKTLGKFQPEPDSVLFIEAEKCTHRRYSTRLCG